MEAMTIEMHEIAQKTRKETVSMRVITSVTLFFLPATFIAVSLLDVLDYERQAEVIADIYEHRYFELRPRHPGFPVERTQNLFGSHLTHYCINFPRLVCYLCRGQKGS